MSKQGMVLSFAGDFCSSQTNFPLRGYKGFPEDKIEQAFILPMLITEMRLLIQHDHANDTSGQARFSGNYPSCLRLKSVNG